MPEKVEECAQSKSAQATSLTNILSDDTVKEYLDQCQTQKSKCLNESFGKTPQFWAKYMDLADRQQKLHFSVNTNDYDQRMLSWKESLPFCFATNWVHYARYGTNYVSG